MHLLHEHIQFFPPNSLPQIHTLTPSSGYAAPILAQINADVGPDPRITWVSLVYTVCSAVWFPIIGRLGDIFGRRYLMILGAVFGLIGSIICATASDVLVLIGGNVFLGSASAFQLSFSYVLQELLPMKYRYLGSGFIYPWSIAGSGFGPVIAYAFVQRYSVGWRGVYWFLLAINAVALALWVCFYFPPTFEEKQRRGINSKMYWIKNFGTSLLVNRDTLGGSLSPHQNPNPHESIC